MDNLRNFNKFKLDVSSLNGCTKQINRYLSMKISDNKEKVMGFQT